MEAATPRAVAAATRTVVALWATTTLLMDPLARTAHEFKLTISPDVRSTLGGEGGMLLGPGERLRAGDLDRWLDQLQDDYQTEVTVVVETCYAGHCIEALSYTGTASRVVVASSRSDQLPYLFSRGQVSFSKVLFD